MARNSLDDLPETFVSTTEASRLASKAVRAGRLRKLASRLYTKDLTSAPETVVRRNIWPIVAGYFPDALIADRTAIEGVPAKDGSVFVVSRGKQSEISLPGHTIKPRRGADSQASDLPFMGILRISSTARALLDNFALSRSRGAASRTLSRKEMERRFINSVSDVLPQLFRPTTTVVPFSSNNVTSRRSRKFLTSILVSLAAMSGVRPSRPQNVSGAGRSAATTRSRSALA